ncbi:lipoate--protein ligase family protein [Ciceribacter azotifigens]|uniref:lipoate--protein ligase family protein n=1 Tax=Ciceribacter azotifigens TaxID=2069303 RepID=UPI003A89F297
MRPDRLARPLAAAIAAAARVHGLTIDPCVEGFTTAAEGLERQERLSDEIDDGCRLRTLLWQVPQALTVGRSDTHLPTFAAATQRLAAENWPVVVRRSGGAACPVSPGTFQIALARTAGADFAIDAAYREFSTMIGDALASIGLVATIGEVAEAFCPGRFDIQIDGRKLGGVSQHWCERNGHRIVTTAASFVLAEDLPELTRAVNLFYESAGGAKRCSANAVISLDLALRDFGSKPNVLCHRADKMG